MKKLLLATLIAAAAAAGAYAQGTIAIDNLNNANTSPTATSGGMVFGPDGSLYTGSLSFEVLGGANASSLTPIATLTGTSQMVNAGTGGLYYDPNNGTYTVPGVAFSGLATLQVEAWGGNFTNLATAQAGGGAWDISNPFQNPTGGSPPATPIDSIGMPAIDLKTTTPEPSVIILGGLGAAALLLFRRHK